MTSRLLTLGVFGACLVALVVLGPWPGSDRRG